MFESPANGLRMIQRAIEFQGIQKRLFQSKGKKKMEEETLEVRKAIQNLSEENSALRNQISSKMNQSKQIEETNSKLKAKIEELKMEAAAAARRKQDCHHHHQPQQQQPQPQPQPHPSFSGTVRSPTVYRNSPTGPIFRADIGSPGIDKSAPSGAHHHHYPRATNVPRGRDPAVGQNFQVIYSFNVSIQ